MNGIPETNTVWLLTTRSIIIAFIPALWWVRWTSMGRRFIGPLSVLMSLFYHGVALASAIMFPCGPAPAVSLIIASHVSVTVWMPWLRILTIQAIHLAVLLLFTSVGSLQPEDACSDGVLLPIPVPMRTKLLFDCSLAAVFPSSGGATGTPLSFSASDIVTHEYLKTIIVLVCNFPFLFYFTRSRRLQFLYEIRDLLLWEQYKYVMTSDLEQTDSELNRVRECLQNATDALMEERK